jgi:tetratricopeptide (TPR) repeat protein
MVRAAVLVAALTVAVAPAAAQTDAELRAWCFEDGATEEQTILGCGAVASRDAEDGATRAMALVIRGALLAGRGELERAIADFDRALTLRPDDPVALRHRGFARDARGEHERAIADYDRAIELKPNYAAAWGDRGLSWASQGQHERALRDLDRSIEIAPTAHMLNSRCWENAMLGRFEAALPDCDHSLRLKVENPAAHASRGYVHLRRKDYAAAIEDFSAALKFKPKDSSSLYGRGLAKTALADKAGGAADIAAAVALRPGVANDAEWKAIRP